VVADWGPWQHHGRCSVGLPPCLDVQNIQTKPGNPATTQASQEDNIAHIQAARYRGGEKQGKEAETERDRGTASIVCRKEACASSERQRERQPERGAGIRGGGRGLGPAATSRLSCRGVGSPVWMWTCRTSKQNRESLRPRKQASAQNVMCGWRRAAFLSATLMLWRVSTTYLPAQPASPAAS